MFTILDYSSALEYSIIRHYTNIVYYYYYVNVILIDFEEVGQTIHFTNISSVWENIHTEQRVIKS